MNKNGSNCNPLTLREIRKLISSTKEIRKLPTAKALRNNPELRLVAENAVADAVMEVYSNGFAIYQKPNHQTVLRMEYVGKTVYEDYQGGRTIYHTFDLEDEDWAVAVMLTGERRMEEQYEEKCRKTTSSISGMGLGEDTGSIAADLELDAGIDILEDIVRKDSLEEMLSLLTDCQRKAVELYYVMEMTESEIAMMLGRGRTTIEMTLDRALARLLKKMEK